MADPKPTHCTHCGAPMVTWLTSGTLVPHAAPWQCIGYLKARLEAQQHAPMQSTVIVDEEPLRSGRRMRDR